VARKRAWKATCRLVFPDGYRTLVGRTGGIIYSAAARQATGRPRRALMVERPAAECSTMPWRAWTTTPPRAILELDRLNNGDRTILMVSTRFSASGGL